MEEGISRELPKGFRLFEYEILETLGAGGFGITYKAIDTNLDKIVVIKEYMPNSCASRQDKTDVTFFPNEKDIFEWGKKKFIQEAKILANFEHPSIVRVYRFFEANNTAYFVMPYYDGETLEDYLNKNPEKQFTQEEILKIMMPIIEGLKAVHKKDIIHGDIAPDNIFLRKGGLPILIDFGAAKNFLGSKSQVLSQAVIKHGYSPPEQYTTNLTQDKTIDIYALSAVFYRMITGKKPTEAILRQMEDEDPIVDIVSEYKDRYSLSFLQTVMQGLSVRVDERIQSIEEFQEKLLEEYNSESKGKKDKTVLVPPEKKPLADNPSSDTDEEKQSSSNKNKNGLLYGIIILLTVVLIGGGIYVFNSKNKLKPPSPPPPVSPTPIIIVKSCDENNVTDCIKKADSYFKQNQLEQAKIYYEKACKLGSNDSCKKKESLIKSNKPVKEQDKITHKPKNINKKCSDEDKALGLCDKIIKCSDEDKALGLCK